MCERYSCVQTRDGKVYDGLGVTHSHADIIRTHGLDGQDVACYEWQPPEEWPDASWFDGLKVDKAPAWERKKSHDTAVEKNIRRLYPDTAAWKAPDDMLRAHEREVCRDGVTAVMLTDPRATRVVVVDGEVIVLLAGTIKSVRGGTIKYVEGGTIKSVRGGTIKYVEGGTIESVEGGTIEYVYGGTITLYAKDASFVIAGSAIVIDHAYPTLGIYTADGEWTAPDPEESR